MLLHFVVILLRIGMHYKCNSAQFEKRLICSLFVQLGFVIVHFVGVFHQALPHVDKLHKIKSVVTHVTVLYLYVHTLHIYLKYLYDE